MFYYRHCFPFRKQFYCRTTGSFSEVLLWSFMFLVAGKSVYNFTFVFVSNVKHQISALTYLLWQYMNNEGSLKLLLGKTRQSEVLSTLILTRKQKISHIFVNHISHSEKTFCSCGPVVSMFFTYMHESLYPWLSYPMPEHPVNSCSCPTIHPSTHFLTISLGEAGYSLEKLPHRDTHRFICTPTNASELPINLTRMSLNFGREGSNFSWRTVLTLHHHPAKNLINV